MKKGAAGALLLAAIVVASAFLGGSSAEAQQADEAEGRRRWKQGQELYAQGKYLDAAKEFEAGYAVAPRPLFLLNIGHAYRRARELAKAKTAYETLLKMQPDLPQRAEVESYIKGIDDAFQAGEAFKTDTVKRDAPPSTALPPSLTLVDPASNGGLAGNGQGHALVQPTPNPLQLDTPPPPLDESEPAHGSLLRKPWFWVIVGAVVAGGIAGVVVATRPSKSCGLTICIVEPPK